MAKLITCNTTSQSFVLSNTVYRAISNACAVHLATVSNTNLELMLADFLAQGLRQFADQRMSEGMKGEAGVTVSYLEATLKGNSE